MAADSIQCPECGETIESMTQMDTEEVQEITSKPKGGLGYGEATQNLYLCKNCRKPLGVGARGGE
jgi:DNA-directed RNA polymerase subunit RPC12/RpoP